MSESQHTTRQLFKISEERARIANCQQAAIFGAIFMMVGVGLDVVVYYDSVSTLLVNRIVTAALLITFAVLSGFIKSNLLARLVVHTVAMLPIASISYMIFLTEGAGSPYYAGLNLVLVGATLLLRWNTFDSAINAMLCLFMYTWAVFSHSEGLSWNSAFIPSYFIFVTGAITTTATYFYNHSRFREFCLSKEVAASNKKLRQINRKLEENNTELEAANLKLKEQGSLLVQSEKLSSLGRMSAGIVHEVNNPLNYSKIALHTLKTFESAISEDEREDYMEVVSDAEEGLVRVIGIITDLRSFTRGDTAAMDQLNVTSFVESARKLASSTLAEIDLEIDIDPSAEIEGNERQLCQLLINFLQNSARAIEVKQAQSGPFQGKVSLATKSDDKLVTLILRDNGCGISEADIERMFEPFFTKNDVGEGMGLGLSICHRILDQHNAKIEVKSVLNEFTEFRIHFKK